MSRQPRYCTAISKSRIGYARLLGRQIAEHGGEQLVVFVVDEKNGSFTDDKEVTFMRPDELPFASHVIHELALCVGADDLAACLVPAMLAEVLRREGDRSVVYLDAATAVRGPLEELGDLARAHAVVLAPRVLAPIPRDAKEPSESDVIGLGLFDPGLVCVAHGAESFLSWWHRALDDLASEEGASPSRAQPFLDFVPELFGARVLSDPRYGVAYWNAHERALRSGADDELLVGNAAVRTIRLVGFDPSQPSLFNATLRRRPRVLLSENEGLARLCADYADQLAGDKDLAEDSQDFSSFSDGAVVDERMRRLVRRERRQRRERAGETQLVPDPFLKESLNDFYSWLASPDLADRAAPLLPRYLGEVVADRFDLRWSFPRIGTVDAPRFREWIERHGLGEEGLPPLLREALEQSAWWEAPSGVSSAPPERLRAGVTFAGYLHSSIGVGEAGRLTLDALARNGIDVAPVAIGQRSSRRRRVRSAEEPEFVADRATNVVWVNADQLSGFASIVGPAFFDGRYTIGGWVWETERLPREMAQSAAFVDEIWVPSSFVHAAVEAVVDRPLYTFAYPLTEPPALPALKRASFGIPEGFLFLFSFDFLSSARRKNPLGVVDAYCRAFSPSDDTVLVLKSVNGRRRMADLEELRLAISSRDDIVLIDQRMEAEIHGALLAGCDAFVSLHRSEGFGLALAQAMLLGKPVIATAYSGNLDFMDKQCAYLVPATPTPVGDGAFPYRADDTWAEPDLDTAAEMMRRVFAAQRESTEVGMLGRVRALEAFAPERTAKFLSERMDGIERRRRSGYKSDVAQNVRDRM